MLKVTTALAADHADVSLTGSIDESAWKDLSACLTALKACRKVRLAAAGVDHANSAGVGLFRDFMTKLSADKEVEIERCASALIDYLHIVSNLFGAAEIVSFHVPMRCPACNESAEALVAVKDVRGAAIPSLSHACPKCKAVMEPDVILEDYLSFLDHAGG